MLAGAADMLLQSSVVPPATVRGRATRQGCHAAPRMTQGSIRLRQMPRIQAFLRSGAGSSYLTGGTWSNVLARQLAGVRPRCAGLPVK